MLTIPLQCFLNDKNIFHINFTHSLTFQWKPLVMAKHGELFESKSLVYVQPLITRLCPLQVNKHGFIVYNCFITINCWSVVHYDIVAKNFAATIYRGDISFALRYILAMISRYREDCTDISMIYHFNVRQSMRCFADISAINRENKAWYSSIIVCITFVQYCNLFEVSNFWLSYIRSNFIS